jgi:hypothetical protein
MNENEFNMSLRAFLKKVGVTSQREIEKAVQSAIEAGQIDGNGDLPASVRLTVGGIDLDVTIEGKISLG